MRFVSLARAVVVVTVVLVGAALPAVALAQESANSLFLGTVTVDGQPAPNLRTVITVVSNGVECGHGLTESGTFSIVLACGAGVAVVNINGVAVDRIDVVPGGTVVRRISLTGTATPPPASPSPAGPAPSPTPPIATPRPPSTGNGAAPAGAPVWLPATVAACLAAALGAGLAAGRCRRRDR